MNAFAELYQCEFTLSQRDNQLRDIADRYVGETEAFDRTVCTGPMGRDGVLPVTPHELALVARNAAAVLDRICHTHTHFTRAEILRAVANADRRGPTL